MERAVDLLVSQAVRPEYWRSCNSKRSPIRPSRAYPRCWISAAVRGRSFRCSKNRWRSSPRRSWRRACARCCCSARARRCLIAACSGSTRSRVLVASRFRLASASRPAFWSASGRGRSIWHSSCTSFRWMTCPRSPMARRSLSTNRAILGLLFSGESYPVVHRLGAAGVDENRSDVVAVVEGVSAHLDDRGADAFRHRLLHVTGLSPTAHDRVIAGWRAADESRGSGLATRL